MEPKAIIIVAAAFIGMASITQAAPQATIKSRFSGQVAPNNTGCLFGEDAMTVSIIDGDKQLAEKNFCSAYGRSKAAAFTTRSGRTFSLVEIGDGHGTNTTIINLTVYRLHADSLDEVLQLPISWATGPTERFTYEYAVGDDQLGGLEITLNARGAAAGDECCVPAEKTQIIRIDQ